LRILVSRSNELKGFARYADTPRHPSSEIVENGEIRLRKIAADFNMIERKLAEIQSALAKGFAAWRHGRACDLRLERICLRRDHARECRLKGKVRHKGRVGGRSVYFGTCAS
jgi:hypothetical protein